MTTSGKSENRGIIFQEGDEEHPTQIEQPFKLYQIPSEYRLGANSTGSIQPNIRQQDDTGEGSLTEQQRTERAKQALWQHLKTLASWFVFGLLALILGVVAWYIPHSNNIAADNAKILTEVENLKVQINQLRDDKNRENSDLQRRIETIENRGVNNIPSER
jgi:hypothetical protein